jgi:hypothetical protein
MSAPEAATTVTSYLPLIQTIAGGLLTLAGGYVGAVMSEKRRQEQEARCLASAFLGEISALRGIVSRRKYLDGLAQAIAEMKEKGAPVHFAIYVRRQYFSVYDKNVDKLGILSAPLPELIASFYTHANAVLEDLDVIRNRERGDSVVELQATYEELQLLIRECGRVADEVVETIRVTYPSQVVRAAVWL